eukprot:5080599-Pyramimonas_sp.AAC.1
MAPHIFVIQTLASFKDGGRLVFLMWFSPQRQHIRLKDCNCSRDGRRFLLDTCGLRVIAAHVHVKKMVHCAQLFQGFVWLNVQE